MTPSQDFIDRQNEFLYKKEVKQELLKQQQSSQFSFQPQINLKSEIMTSEASAFDRLYQQDKMG